MPGRNAREAWRNFADPIKRVVTCVDLAARVTERQIDENVRRIAAPASGIPFGTALSLNFGIDLAPVEGNTDWRMTTLKYDYTLVLAKQPTEIVFGWHWHPFSKRSSVTYPHVHVPSASAFKTKHIPTGRISLEDVIVFGFQELGVLPAHENALHVVSKVMGNHKANRSWA